MVRSSPNTKAVRVMLADDQQIVVWGLQKLLAEHSNHFEVVAVVNGGQEVIATVEAAEPDVLVLELGLEAHEPDILLRLRRADRTRVLIYSSVRETSLIDQAMLNGARGFVRKEDPPEQLLNAIRKVHDGELWIDRQTSSRLLSELASGGGRRKRGPQSRLDLLTPREMSIFDAIAGQPGARNKQLAAQLGISEHTLRNHLSSIFGKLQLRNRFELFSFASQHRRDSGNGNPARRAS